MAIGKPVILFCEDIREETAGKFSLSGVLGSGLELATDGSEFVFPRFCVCVLIAIDGQNEVPVTISLEANGKVELPDSFETIGRNEKPTEPVWDLRLNFIANNFAVPTDTRLTVTVNAGDQVSTAFIDFKSAAKKMQ